MYKLPQCYITKVKIDLYVFTLFSKDDYFLAQLKCLAVICQWHRKENE